MAVMIAEHLKDMVDDYRIVSPGNACLDEARNNLQNDGYETNVKSNWYDEGVAFSHIWVEAEVDGEMYAFDSTGVQPVQDMYAYWGAACAGSFTLEEMRDMSNELTWNPTFDREQLPSMQAMIDEGFARCK